MNRALLVATALAVLPVALGCGGSKGGSLKDISVTPNRQTTTVGVVTQFMATLNYDKGKGPSVKPTTVWNSTDKTVATIDTMGRATALKVGMTTITAAAGGKMGSAMLIVSNERVLTAIQLTTPGGTPRVPVRRAIPITATGVYSDQTTANLTAMAEWTSSAPANATVTNSGVKGLVVGIATGTTRISAQVGMIKGEIEVTVTNPTLTSLSVTPPTATIARNTNQKFTATASYNDMTTLDVTGDVTWTSSMPAVASISNDGANKGVASGLTGGMTTITANLDGSSMASATLTVRAGDPTGLVLTPANPTLAMGATQKLTATATFPDGSTQDVSANATWASATVATATVAADGTVTAVAAGTSVVSATFGALSAMTTVTVTTATVSTITVTPTNATMARGTTQQYTANAVYTDMTNRDVTAEVTWGSTTDTVATVSNATGTKGVVTAVAAGATMVTATLDGKVGSTDLTVTGATLVALAVSPENATIANTTSVSFEARGLFSDGTNQDLTSQVSWQSSNAAVATISNAVDTKGLATGVAPGFVDITASLNGVMKTTRLTITSATLVSITVTPPLPQLAQGTGAQLQATGNFSDGTVQNLTESASWTSTATGVATVSITAGTRGRVTAVAPGTAQIRAAVGAVQGSATLTVTNATLTSITISPSNPTVARNTTVDLTASGVFSDGSNQDLTVAVAWTSAGSAIASVSTGGATPGRVRGGDPGTAMITATLGAISGSTTVTVTAATLMSISVAPASVTIAKTTMTALVATGTFSDTTTQNLTASVFWSSASTTIATVSNGSGTEGYVTGVDAGTTNVSAALFGISGMSAVTVTNATIASMAVTPANPSIGIGTTQQFTATGTFSDMTTQNLNLQAIWASATPAVAVISNAAGSRGVATGVTAGTSVITGTFGGVTGMTTLTVNAPAITLVSVSITPGAPTIVAGSTQQLTLTGVYSDNSTQNLTEDATWSSNNMTATVSTAMGTRGLVTAGGAAGTSIITATVGGKTAMVTVTVTALPLLSITLSPLTPTAPIGTQPQFTATGNYMGGGTANITADVTWGSSMPTVATIATGGMNIGQATAVAVGTTTITATLGGITGSTTLTVSPATLMTITISPNPIKIAKTTMAQLAAQGTYTDGRVEDVTNTATWGTGNPTFATVSNVSGEQGQVTATSTAGATSITATIGMVVGTAPITVTNAVITSMAVSPTNPTVPAGLNQQFQAIGTFVDTTVMPTDTTTQNLHLQATWASSMTGVATVSNAVGTKGLVTTLTMGTSVISAVYNGVSGNTLLTVDVANLVSILVTPSPVTIAKGTTQQFTATGIYSNNTTQNLTAMVTWSTGTPAVASISNVGLATGLTPGNTTVTGTLSAVSGSSTLTVTNATIQSMAVRGAPVGMADPAVSLVAGATHQFYAIGTFSDASSQDLTTQVYWASSDLSLATINTTGLGRGVAPGMPSVTAIFRDATSTLMLAASRSLTVSTKTLTSIAITPPSPTIAAGVTTQLTATGTYSDGSTDDLTDDATWSIAPAMGVAAVSNGAGTEGQLTGIAMGTATVTATFNMVLGTNPITVSAATLTGIEITPGVATNITVNTTQNFTAVGRLSDGNVTTDLTAMVTWASSAPAVASITNGVSPAVATAGATPGMATTISALYNGHIDSMVLTTIP